MSLVNAVGGVLNYFNYLDYAFVSFLVVAMLVGGFKGFSKQVVSWFFWIVAAYVAYFYSVGLSERFLSGFFTSPLVRIMVANLAIFTAAFVLSRVVNRMVQCLLSLSGLVVFDRFLGVYFGLVQGLIMVAVLVTSFSSTRIHEEPWWSQSRIVVMASALMPIYAEDSVNWIEAKFADVHGVLMKRFVWTFEDRQ